MKQPKIIIIVGHYGAGKTNVAVNLALELARSGKVAVADLDIVNPFFRTADFRKLFQSNNIALAVSDYANTNLDIPALNLNIKGLTASNDFLIIDVGGDNEGAKALGRFADEIKEVGYAMYYVANFYRYLTRTAEESFAVMREIEAASGLLCAAIINNSNLGAETTEDAINASTICAEELSRLAGAPLLEVKRKVYVKKIWEGI